MSNNNICKAVYSGVKQRRYREQEEPINRLFKCLNRVALVLLILIVGMSIGYTLRIYHESIVDAYYRAYPEDEEQMKAGREQNEQVSKVKFTPKFAKRFHAEPGRKRPGAFFNP